MTARELKEYNEIKAQYPTTVLLFRVGDFYEAYFEDAKNLVKATQITLAQQSDGTPMAGFPFHALDTYLPKLVRNGHRVAICDALSNQK